MLISGSNEIVDYYLLVKKATEDKQSTLTNIQR